MKAIGKIIGLVVDEEDDYLLGLAWHQDRDGYLRHVFCYFDCGQKRYETLSLHRVIAMAMPGEEVDHINGRLLDNRRANLRIVSRAENSQNLKPRGQSGVRGVHRVHNLWKVSFVKEGKRYTFGSFSTIEEAALTAKEAAMKLYPFLNDGGIDAWSIT
jgi:hypothetical protein